MVVMNTVHGKGDTVGWGLLDMPGWGGNCFVKCSGAAQEGPPTLLSWTRDLMDK